MRNPGFWYGRKVFITGHTGFKGSWLCIWLNSLGAEITGYALQPPTEPSLFQLANVGSFMKSIIADVRDPERLQSELISSSAEIVIHMAAQPLVRDSYKIPLETYTTNVMGTVNLLEAVRHSPAVRTVLNVTTDKVYENHEWVWGYRENEPFGGHDPYSNSKACSELVTAAYRSSYFNPSDFSRHRVAVASARAGNVIGGGDWANDRLIPDIISALLDRKPVHIRNPHAIRPWQHVLEPLSGYMTLSERLYLHGPDYAEGWNFGPEESDARTVGWITERLCKKWGDGASYGIDNGYHPHEATHLRLDCSKARSRLDWRPLWTLDKALDAIIRWTEDYRSGRNLLETCQCQIEEYSELFKNIQE